MADDEDVVTRGIFEDAMSEPLDQAARNARQVARDLTEVGAAGEVAGAGMDKASRSADRLAKELNDVERAAERQRLAALRLQAVESDAERTRRKGVLTAQDSYRVESSLAAARNDARRAADDLRAAHERLDRATESLGRRMLRAVTAVHTLELAFKGLRVAALASVLTSVVAGLSALGAGAIGAVAGLAPLLGLVAGLPALGLAAVSAFGAVSLLSAGIGKAAATMASSTASVQQINSAFMGLSPTARRLAMEIAPVIRSFKAVREEALASAYPALHETLLNLSGLMPVLQRSVIGVAGALSDAAASGSRMVAGPWSSEIADVLARNVTLLRTFASAAVSAAGALLHVMHAAGPMVQMLADAASRWLQMKEASLATSSGQARLTAFFDRVGRLAIGVAHAIGQLWGGLKGLFAGATPMADHLGSSIGSAFERFNAWANSVQGQNRIRKFFTDTIPVLDAFGRLLASIGHAFARLASGGGQSGIISILDGVRSLIGPMTTLLLLLTKVMGAIPGGGALAGLTVLATNRRFGMGISPATLAKGAGGLIRGTYRFGAGVAGRAGAGTIASRAGMRLGGMLGIGGAAEGAEAGAAGLLPLIANPIGAAVAGTAALGVGLGVLYAKWRPFHDAVNATGRIIRDVFVGGFHWLADNIGSIGHVMASAFGPVGTLFNAIAGNLGKVGNVLSHIPGLGFLGGHRYTGGPVLPGGAYVVGEQGPEILVQPSGMRVIGGDGAAVLSGLTEPGWVLPNTVSAPVINLAEPSPLPADWPRPGDGPPSPDYGALLAALPPITIGPVYASDDVDLERAVRAGIAAWFRERADRR